MERLNISIEPAVAEMISEYTMEGRKAASLLADCYGVALQRCDHKANEQKTVKITRADLEEIIQSSRRVPFATTQADNGAEVGKILGLGVRGFLGSILEIEAIAFPAKAKGRGTLRFNEPQAPWPGLSFNAASVVRQLTCKEISDYDLHVNVIGGGNLDGPSAGLAMALALISALEGIPIRQDVAVTGEISLQGRVKPVGGIQEKIYGAMQARVRRVLVPMDNEREIPKDLEGIEVVPVERAQDAWSLVFVLDESPMASHDDDKISPLSHRASIQRLSS